MSRKPHVSRASFGIGALAGIIAVGITLLTYTVFRPKDSVSLVICALSILLGMVAAIGCGMHYLGTRKNNHTPG